MQSGILESVTTGTVAVLLVFFFLAVTTGLTWTFLQVMKLISPASRLKRVLYLRSSYNTFFLLPTAAVGVEKNGRFFFEAAWLCWAIGVGTIDPTDD